MRRLDRHRLALEPDLFRPIPPTLEWRTDGAHAARAFRTEGRPRRQEGATMSDKIKPHHLGRKAILYVRQSSAHQVTPNQESRILQCDARSALRLGLARDRSH